MQFVQSNIADRLQLFMDSEKLGQIEVAEATGVSQPTICRVLKRGYVRRSGARRRIEKYLSNNASKINKKSQLPLDVARALREVWDKTEDHARELAKVIRSLDGLSPNAKLKENARKNRTT